jgi:PPM family protein phosphatase
MSFEIRYFGKTDVGLKRTNNEDSFVVRPDLGFCSVADGMGGAAAGEVASRIFVETCAEVFAGRDASLATADLVKKAFTEANMRILDYVASHPGDQGMGCTAEILAFDRETVVIGHVGDSRTYRLRNGELKQLTIDHSLVQTQIDQGLITPQEARTHPMRHMILRAVGTKDAQELDVLTGKGLPGDLFLLCSDGLTDMIDDAEILKNMAGEGDLQAMAGRLIDKAKAAGGKDNVTVVLAQLAGRI